MRSLSKGIDQLTAEVNPTKNTTLVTKSKAIRLEKLIKIIEVNVTKAAQAKMLEQVFETTLVDDFEDEDFPYFEKGRWPGALLDGIVHDPNNEVQAASGKNILRITFCKGKIVNTRKVLKG